MLTIVLLFACSLIFVRGEVNEIDTERNVTKIYGRIEKLIHKKCLANINQETFDEMKTFAISLNTEIFRAFVPVNPDEENLNKFCTKRRTNIFKELSQSFKTFVMCLDSEEKYWTEIISDMIGVCFDYICDSKNYENLDDQLKEYMYGVNSVFGFMYEGITRECFLSSELAQAINDEDYESLIWKKSDFCKDISKGGECIINHIGQHPHNQEREDMVKMYEKIFQKFLDMC